MAAINDGGPAFPRPASEDRFNEENYSPHVGMSLRDWFAGQAMAALLASPQVDIQPGEDWYKFAKDTAEAALGYADAMLKAREVAAP